MAHYVISDIHGEGDRFQALLEQIGFSEKDVLYILGDVIDRGPDGVALLRRIMDTPNMVMLLGNHEYMCLQCFSPQASAKDFRRWGRNGSAPTLDAMEDLPEGELLRLIRYLMDLPDRLEVEVAGKRFYLVHGFPGQSCHDRVWGRPDPDAPNPVPGRCLIIGHTPVLYMPEPADEDERIREMVQKGEHLRIYHGPGFINIDCGCGHAMPVKALACLRLEDMAEFYA